MDANHRPYDPASDLQTESLTVGLSLNAKHALAQVARRLGVPMARLARAAVTDRILTPGTSPMPSAQLPEKHRLSPARRAAIAAEKGEPYAAAFEESFNAAKAEAMTAGAQAFRERCRQIILSPEASGRSATAKTLALDTDLSVEAARNLLASLPANPFEAPTISGVLSNAPATAWDEIASDLNAKTGFGGVKSKGRH